MILSVLTFGNFFHFNVTAVNFERLLPVEIYGKALSMTETERLALPPYHSVITHIVTSYNLFIVIISCPYICDEFPIIYFAHVRYEVVCR